MEIRKEAMSFTAEWQIKVRLACVATVSVRLRSKERGTRVKDCAKNGARKRVERGWGRKEGNLPLPLPPLSFFDSRFISRAAKTGLSLLRNQTGTLATQAKTRVMMRFVFVDQNGRKEKQYTH